MFPEWKQLNEGSWGTRSKSWQIFAYTWGKPQEKIFWHWRDPIRGKHLLSSLMVKWCSWESLIKRLGKSSRNVCLGAEAASSNTWRGQDGNTQSEAGVVGNRKYNVAIWRWWPVLGFSSTDADPNLQAFKVFLTKELEIYFLFLFLKFQNEGNLLKMSPTRPNRRFAHMILSLPSRSIVKPVV